MDAAELIKSEIEKAAEKKKELHTKLRELEAAEPKNFNEIWRVRDQLAYWEGKHEGLSFALQTIK